MISRHFALSSELTGAIAKRLPHSKNQLSPPSSFFNHFVTYIYTYTNRVLIVRIYSIYTLPGQKNSTTTKTSIEIVVLRMIYSQRNYTGTKKYSIFYSKFVNCISELLIFETLNTNTRPHL